ncbi:MAG: hypothetical protein AB7L90_02490 [Hyphomicrobiaceae bacterium]
MAFGKRAAAPPTPSISSVDRLRQIEASERLNRLRDSFMELLGTAQMVADSVRQQGPIPVPPLGDHTDPEAGPFVLAGFSRHFVTRSPNGLGHVIFGYQGPDGEGPVDPNAQFQLQQTIGELLAFNLYCQRAEIDEALGVALQAPGVADRIDGILVKLAYFVAFFDNMTMARRDEMMTAEDIERQRANVERYLLIARDKMLDPDHLEARIPTAGWPFVGVELPFEPHEGDYFINCVYFPAEYAEVLLSAQKTANARPANAA